MTDDEHEALATAELPLRQRVRAYRATLVASGQLTQEFADYLTAQDPFGKLSPKER
jgi:hypothetical protein